MGTWTDLMLGDLCSLRAGAAFKRDAQGATSGDLPFIKVSDMNLTSNEISIVEANNWVSRAEARNMNAKPFPAGTTVFAKIGEALKQNRVRLLVRDTVIDNNMMGAIPNTNVVDPAFFFHLLRTVDFARQATGTAMPYLTVKTLSRIHLRIPTLSDQRKIAAVLSTYDELIQNNSRCIQILEEMAQAIYSQWFVQFRYPGCEDVPLTDTDLGPIPRGWRICSIADLAAPKKHAVTSGPFGSKLGRKDYVEFGVPVIRGVNLMVGGGFRDSEFVFVSASKADELQSCIAVPGDILVTQRGTLGQVGLIPASARFERYVLSQSQMKITVDNQQANPQYVYAVLRSEGAVRQIRSMAISAGVPHINLTMLREFRLVLPTQSLQTEFDAVVGPMLVLVENLQLSTEVLRATRDLLLPRLVSGEIEVSELDIAVGDAAA